MRRKTWNTCVAAALLAGPLMYCADQSATSPKASASRQPAASTTPATLTPALVRQLAAGRGVVPLPPAPYVRPALARLGRALVFDKILSGNRDISCTTCHLPEFATGDGRSLSVGQGGTGFGPARRHARRGLHPAQRAAAVQHRRDAAPLLGRTRRSRRARSCCTRRPGISSRADAPRASSSAPSLRSACSRSRTATRCARSSGNELAAVRGRGQSRHLGRRS